MAHVTIKAKIQFTTRYTTLQVTDPKEDRIVYKESIQYKLTDITTYIHDRRVSWWDAISSGFIKIKPKNVFYEKLQPFYHYYLTLFYFHPNLIAHGPSKPVVWMSISHASCIRTVLFANATFCNSHTISNVSFMIQWRVLTCSSKDAKSPWRIINVLVYFDRVQNVAIVELTVFRCRTMYLVIAPSQITFSNASFIVIYSTFLVIFFSQPFFDNVYIYKVLANLIEMTFFKRLSTFSQQWGTLTVNIR